MHRYVPVELPALVASWYFVCRSRELRAGGRIAFELPGISLVVYRGVSGRAHAIAGHCAHMGAHLVQGEVIGERLRCPLHHWTYDGDGRCTAPSSAATPRQATYPVVERDGGLFVFVGGTPAFSLPSWIDHTPGAHAAGADADRWRVSIGGAVPIDTPWQACAMNGFDMLHLETVHERALREPAIVQARGPHVLELGYVSRVTGQGLADRLMRVLARDCVRVTLQCWGGNLFVVRSEAGPFVNHLMLCLTPVPPSAGGATLRVTPLVAVPRTRLPGLDRLRARISRWLFLAFLGRDLEPLSGMRLRAAGAVAQDGPLATFVRWLAARPAVEVEVESDVACPPADAARRRVHV